MLKWQQDHIRKNFTTLLNYTSCDTLFLSKLFAQNVLSQSEWERVAAAETKHDKSKLLFDILTTRVNGYEELMDASLEFNQTGTYKVLKSGIVECVPNPIKTTPPTDGDQDQKIVFLSKTPVPVITELPQHQPREEIMMKCRIPKDAEIGKDSDCKPDQDLENAVKLSKWELVKLRYKLDNIEREKQRKERAENEERLRKINNHLANLRPRPVQLKSKANTTRVT